MKKLLTVFVGCLIFAVPILPSSPRKPELKPRGLFKTATMDLAIKIVKERGFQGFVDALKKQELSDEVYDLPLHTIKVPGQTTNVGELLGTLDKNDKDELGIMASYFSRGGKPYLKDRVMALANQSHQVLIDALKSGEFPDAVYDLPLHEYKVKGQSKKKIAVADILAELRESDPQEKGIMDGYFSRAGKSYLVQILNGAPNLKELSGYLIKYPFVMEYVNPFNVFEGGPSMGFWVEASALENDKDAQAIKDAYSARNGLWKTYYEEASQAGLPEIKIIESLALIKKLVNEGGFTRFKEAFVKKELDDNAYDVNLEKVKVTEKAVQVTLGSVLKEQVIKGDADARAIYQKYILKGGQETLRKLIEKVIKSGDLTEFVKELDYCPAVVTVNLFDPKCRLGFLVEEKEAHGSPQQKSAAQKIKDTYSAERWARHKERYKDANSLQDCLKKTTLDAEGIAVLKAYKTKTPHIDDKKEVKIVHEYIAHFKSSLPLLIKKALAGTDTEEIKVLEAWLRGFEEAGIDLEGETIAVYQERLKKRKEDIVKLGANSGTPENPANVQKTGTFWPRLRKGALFITTGLVAAYVYDKYFHSSTYDMPQKIVVPASVS